VAKMTAILDDQGKLLGAVRTEAVTSDNRKVAFRPDPRYQHQPVEVPDDLLSDPTALHKHIESKLAKIPVRAAS
jgi:hypothetical protein